MKIDMKHIRKVQLVAILGIALGIAQWAHSATPMCASCVEKLDGGIVRCTNGCTGTMPLLNTKSARVYNGWQLGPDASCGTDASGKPCGKGIEVCHSSEK